MARPPTKGRRGFIWLPREASPSWELKINSESVRERILPGTEVVMAVCPEISSFKIILVNADEYYSTRYSKGQTIQYYADLDDGTVQRAEGTIDKIFNRYDNTYGAVTEISGISYVSFARDVLVTESYEGDTNVESIFNELVSNYLPGFTLNFTSSSTKTPTINWDEKPLWDCFYDLCKIITADCRINYDKTIDVFDKNSQMCKTESVVMGDLFISCKGIGDQSMTVRNKIRVYGDDGTGLPIIYQAHDSSSESSHELKEKAVFDTKINSVTNAEELANAELELGKEPETEGEVESLILPSLKEGQKLWISHPIMKIHDTYRVYKMTHKLPNERTVCVIGKERRLPQIFKKRVENELALQTITNPYKMTGSWNMTFDSETEIDSKDSNVQIKDGKISLSSGTQGQFTVTKIMGSSKSNFHPLVSGSNIKDVKLELSVDGGDTYTTLAIDSLNSYTTGGTNLVLRGTISNDAELDSIAILSKE